MRPGFATILAHVSAMTGLSHAMILDWRHRSGRRVPARDFLAYCCHEYAGMSYPEIATAMDRESHSSCEDGAARFRGKLITSIEQLERVTREAKVNA